MKREHINQPSITTTSEEALKSEQEKHNSILKNLQIEFGVSEDELTSMLDGEHFNHQH